MNSKTHVERLAAYVAGINYAEAPADVRERVKTCLLYNLTMGIAGWVRPDPVGEALRAVHAAPGPSSVIFSGERLSPADAAFVNAAFVTARGQNDTHPDVVTHIGCVVIPAVLALAQARGAQPDDLLSAILAGYETVPKLAKGAAQESTARGFRPTSVYSVLGAAAAAARVLRLNLEQTASAIAIATNFSGGLLQCWVQGTPEWRLQVAHASRSGVVAALLAEQGMSGTKKALEGESGFYKAFAAGAPPLVLEGWEIRDVTFKPYPGCAFNQSPVHALRLLLRQHAISTGEVEQATVDMNPQDLGYPGVSSYGPFETSAGAIMSGPFMLAATLRDGAPAWAHFAQEYGAGPLHAASRIVRLRADDSLARWTCRIGVRLRDGSSHEILFKEARPFVMDWQDTVELLRPVVAEWRLPDAQQRFADLQTMLGHFERGGDGGALLTLCGHQESAA
jgi:2-methylcitrate dehydratase PrpD